MDGEGAPRGSRGRPRGRGRGHARVVRGAGGRGRGASAASISGPTSSNSHDTEMPDASTSGPSTSSASAVASSTKPDPEPTASAARATSAAPSSASRSVTPTRGAIRGGRGGRFLPRAIRRSALDREAIANQEISKVEDQEKHEARMKRAVRGGRGSGRRARGGPVNFGAIIRGGGGGFGSGIQASAGARSGGSYGFGSTGGFGTSSSGGGSGGSGSGSGFTLRQGMKIENGGPQFNTSSRPTGPRMNTASFAEIVHENIEMDSKEKTPLLPMGIRRVDPKPIDAPVATPDKEDSDPMITSDDSSDIGDVFHNEVEGGMTDEGKKWPGVSENKTVKIEGEEITNIDHLTRRLAQQKLKLSEEKEKKKYEGMDWEDRYHAEKMATQRLLFGIDSDDDDDDEGESKEAEAKPKRNPLIQDGSLYIFQFPPVMPPLHVSRPAPGDTTDKGPIKDEPVDDDADVNMSDTPTHDPNNPVDLDEVKDEDGEEMVAGTGSSNNNNKSEAPSTNMQDQPGGHLGQLVIRKSGKMQMNYGGMLFDVEMAMPISHLREAVLIVDKGGPPDADGYHGTAYGMGRIAGKFNAVPHWEDVKPWNVDPKELPPWGCDAAPEGTTLEDYAHLLAKK